MVNTLRHSGSEQLRQGLFDYLNLNRHKFNEHGQFETAPNEQDYLPRTLLVSDEFIKPPKLPPETPRLNRAQQHRAKFPEANMLRNPLTDEDYVLKRYNERLDHAKKRRKYKKNDCDTHLDAAMTRCSDMYWNNALYPKDAYDSCVQRANELWQECYNKKRYPEGKMEWANRDMDIIDEAPASDQGAVKSDSTDWSVFAPPLMIPLSDKYAHAKSLRLWQPLVEGSVAANDNFPMKNNPRLRLVPRTTIKATPGMGFIGNVPGMGGGGKPRLLPRHPGDPRVETKLY
jgi:hypothetical protein